MSTWIGIDGAVLLWIQENLRSVMLTPIVKLITHLGDYGGIWILLALFFLCLKKTRRVGVIAGVSLAVSYAVNNLFLKNAVARIRPYEVISGLECLVEKQHDLSFPSGHAASSFAVAYICYKLLPRRYGIPLLLLAGLIALSRLYVGVHYPSDVLFGTLSGTLIAALTLQLFERLRRKKEEKPILK